MSSSSLLKRFARAAKRTEEKLTLTAKLRLRSAMLSCIGRHRDCSEVQLKRTLAALKSGTRVLCALNLWLESGAKMRSRIFWTRPIHFCQLEHFLGNAKKFIFVAKLYLFLLKL